MPASRRDFIRRIFVLPLASLTSVVPLHARGAEPRPKSGETERVILAGFPVAGVRHHASPDLLRRMRPGKSLAVRAEPANPFDESAVALRYRRRRIGYVPRDQNQILARLLAQGVSAQAVITAIDLSAPPWEAVWVELSIEGRS